MPTYASTTSSAYLANAVLTASSPQLIVMLYDGARRFLHQAAAAMKARDIPTAHNKLRRAEMIIRHLRNTLDLERGEIATNLFALYDFCLRRCQKARIDQDPAILEHVIGLLGKLRQSWATIAASEEAARATAEPLVAGTAA
jgi:flagellar secretion chaperone FliS